MPDPIAMTAFRLAQRYIGVKELPGGRDHPLVQWWLSLCGFSTDSPDEIAWCSAFVNGIAWELDLPRSKSAAARSWLGVGTHVNLIDAVAGFDVVVLKRGVGVQPGSDVRDAPGHVGFFASYTNGQVEVLGGNQANSVRIERFGGDRILGIRRLV